MFLSASTFETSARDDPRQGLHLYVRSLFYASGAYVHMLEDLSRRGSGLAHRACVAGESLAHDPSSLLGVPHRLKIRPIYTHGNVEALETRG